LSIEKERLVMNVSLVGRNLNKKEIGMFIKLNGEKSGRFPEVCIKTKKEIGRSKNLLVT
jgi:hypothetical protein